MPSIVFSDAEREALRGLPWLVRCLYFEIRSRMDFKSGFVGLARGAGVSWQTFMEALYVEPHPGLTGAGTPSKAKIRRASEWLEKAGLVEMRSREKKLAFFCPLAMTDSCAEKKPGTRAAQSRPSDPGTGDRHAGVHCDEGWPGKPGTTGTHAQQLDPGIPPGTERSDQPFFARGLHPLPEDFTVTQAHRDYAELHGLPSPEAHVEPFREYFKATGQVLADWDARFHKWLHDAHRYEKRNEKRGNGHEAHKPYGEGRPLSAVERVERAHRSTGKVIQLERRAYGDFVAADDAHLWPQVD